jgi:hypothetical protein
LRGRRIIALVTLLVDRVARIDQGGFGAGQHVPVQVERRADAGVPEPLLYALRARPGGDQQRRARVPQAWNLSPCFSAGSAASAGPNTPRMNTVVDRLAAGRVEHRVLRACAGSGLCQVLGQHVVQPAGRLIVMSLPFSGRPTSRRYVSTVARSRRGWPRPA